jgi:hypothetical protein
MELFVLSDWQLASLSGADESTHVVTGRWLNRPK